jgi:hypothetical protein
MKRCAVLALRALVVSSVVTVSAQTPAIQKRQLSNGLLVWIVEHHDLPVVQMSLLVLSGTDDDPPGRYGIASLTSAMLTEGAGSRSSVEIADALDALGANLSTSIGADSSSIQLHVPSARLADALPLMAEAAQRPMFSTRELERLRQNASSRCGKRATIPTRSRRWRSHASSTDRRTATEQRQSVPPRRSRCLRRRIPAPFTSRRTDQTTALWSSLPIEGSRVTR